MAGVTSGESTNEGLYHRGLKVIPGGVNSPVRAFRSVGGTPYFVARGEGAYVWDVEGTQFLDYVQSYGASILGHANPVVIEAVRSAALSGTTFGAPTEGEVRLAEELCSRVPGMEQVRLVSSGTEAAMSALRLARGVTGRDTVVKFAGHYHGHSDALLAAGGSGVADQGLSGSAGVTAGAVADTVVAPWNVVPRLDESVAVVCVEPVAANMGLVPAAPGFLAELRRECDRVGALLLFDEVITGFRVDHGGATALFGVQPDVWCFGKVIGGGLPVGAFGASAEIMSNLAPLGDVYQAGTLSGNPLATAAGAAVLSQLVPAAYEQLVATATALADGLASAFAGAGVSVTVPRVGPLVGLFFGDSAPNDYDDAKRSVDLGHYPRWFHGMLSRGIALAPGPYEVMFPSLAHSEADIARTVEAAAEVAAEIADVAASTREKDPS
ncbi:MAG: glutamate-1-semialdehyde 2,1-aminomutase [Acidimicrobiales bacterium]